MEEYVSISVEFAWPISYLLIELLHHFPSADELGVKGVRLPESLEGLLVRNDGKVSPGRKYCRAQMTPRHSLVVTE